MEKVTGSGKTLEKAIDDALQKLCLTIDQAEYVVISNGGFFRNCKVEMWKKPTEGERQRDFLQQLLNKAGFDLNVTLSEDSQNINLNIEGKDSTAVIGYRGDVLDSLQLLTSIVVKNSDSKHFFLDCENYREKRRLTLIKLANNLEQKVLRTAKKTKLEPMNAYERRIIHTTLKDSTKIKTHSEGTEPFRYVVIEPLFKNSAEKNPQEKAKEDTYNTQRKQLNFVFRTKSKRPYEK
mgnify:CR=1 FL=1